MLYVVTYDVHAHRLRRKVAQVLQHYGRRVQFSVFECHLSAGEARDVRRQLARLRPRKKDALFSVRFYRLCQSCQAKTEIIGTGALTEDASFYVV